MCSLTCASTNILGIHGQTDQGSDPDLKKSHPAQDYFNLDEFPNLINFMSTWSHIDTAEEEAHWWVVGTILVKK